MITEEKHPLIYRAARNLARKHNIKMSEALKIVYSQFKFVSKVMAKGDFEGVLLPGLGSFIVKHNRLKNCDNRKLIQLEQKNLLKGDA